MEGPTSDKAAEIFASKPAIALRRFVNFTHNDAIQLEKQTRKQAESNDWHTVRLNRITASKFGYTCKRQLINENLKKHRDILNIPQVALGIQEKNIRDLYLEVGPHIK